MNEIIILSTACGAQFMPGFFNCLKENGERKIKIIGVDSNDDPSVYNFVDVFYKVPNINESNYIDTLLEICVKEKVNVFFPMISGELDMIQDNIDKFTKKNILVAITNNEKIKFANNKLKMYQYMEKHNFNAPKYMEIKSVEDLEPACCAMGYPYKPVCIKIANGSGSRGVRIIDNNKSRLNLFLYSKPSSLYTTLNDMIETLKDWNGQPEIFAMEYLPGKEYTVDLLADKGKVIYIAGRRNDVSIMSIAQESTLLKEDIAYDECIKLVELFELDGNIGFDFMYNEIGVPVLTDINPRITATVCLANAGGINLPYSRIKQLLKEELTPKELNYGIKLKRKYLDIIV